MLHAGCLKGEGCGQWAAKDRLLLHLHSLTEIVKKGIYWPIYMPYRLSLTYCYSLFAWPEVLELSYTRVSSVASFSLSVLSWTLLIKLKIIPVLCLLSLDVFTLFTVLCLNMSYNYCHQNTISYTVTIICYSNHKTTTTITYQSTKYYKYSRF
jgi:hypothetical protein